MTPQNTPATDKVEPYFHVRGVVLRPDDFDTLDWVTRAERSGLTTIGTHDPRAPSVVESYMKSEPGRRLEEKCLAAGIQLEHELHVIKEFLPRDLFKKNPELFRMNEEGNRDPKHNCCVTNKHTLEIISDHAARTAIELPPTTGRYLFWIDDNKPMCRCQECDRLSDTDQALILENAMLKAVRTVDPKATMAHLSYANTLAPPKDVKPESGIFLEFVPIERHYMMKLSNREAPGRRGLTHGDILDYLDANLKIFSPSTTRILEYWLNARMFYRIARANDFPIFWSPSVFEDDLNTYASRGIRHISCFAAGLNGSYVKEFGEPPIGEYGNLLQQFRPGSS